MVSSANAYLLWMIMFRKANLWASFAFLWPLANWMLFKFSADSSLLLVCCCHFSIHWLLICADRCLLLDRSFIYLIHCWQTQFSSKILALNCAEEHYFLTFSGYLPSQLLLPKSNYLCPCCLKGSRTIVGLRRSAELNHYFICYLVAMNYLFSLTCFLHGLVWRHYFDS